LAHGSRNVTPASPSHSRFPARGSDPFTVFVSIEDPYSFARVVTALRPDASCSRVVAGSRHLARPVVRDASHYARGFFAAHAASAPGLLGPLGRLPLGLRGSRRGLRKAGALQFILLWRQFARDRDSERPAARLAKRVRNFSLTRCRDRLARSDLFVRGARTGVLRQRGAKKWSTDSSRSSRESGIRDGRDVDQGYVAKCIATPVADEADRPRKEFCEHSSL
jgi:hypothetical protein